MAVVQDDFRFCELDEDEAHILGSDFEKHFIERQSRASNCALHCPFIWTLHGTSIVGGSIVITM